MQPQPLVQAQVQVQALRRLVLEQEHTGSEGQGQQGDPLRAFEAQQSETETETIEEVTMFSVNKR